MAKLITITELARRIRYSVSHIRRLVKDGMIASIQPAGKGGKLFFSTDVVEAFLNPARAQCDSIQKPRITPGPKPAWTKNKESQKHAKNQKKT